MPHLRHLPLELVHGFGVKLGDGNNGFSNIHRLNDKFVVLYAGNIGLNQGIESVVAVAKHHTDLNDLCFPIVGNGNRRVWLEKQLTQEKMSKIVLLPYQSRSVGPQIYASSNLCLLPLKKGTAQENFPSKIYTIMAAGRPAIVSADINSELTWLTTAASYE